VFIQDERGDVELTVIGGGIKPKKKRKKKI